MRRASDIAPPATLFTHRGALKFDVEEAVRTLGKADPVLRELMERVGPFRLKVASRFSPFEALSTSIAYQQLTAKAAGTILSRVKAAFPGAGFPSPQAVLAAPDERLRGAGLSRAKTAALKDLAAHTVNGTLPGAAGLRKLSDEEVIERVTVVRGIGPWTAQMLLIFRMGRPDVLPENDYGVRKGFTRVYRRRTLVSPQALLRQGERWRPFRTVASWYLWRALEL